MSKIYNIEEVLDVVEEIDGKVISVKNGIIEDSEDSNTKEVLLGEERTDKFLEGKLIKVYVNKYERDKDARDRCIEHYGAICKACHFDFEATFGSIGKGYIHVHHKNHLHEVGEEHEVDAINELIPVCPNCHAMLHCKGSSNIDMTVEELREIIKTNKNI